MANKLHIVCFDNPYPPDYGGVIDAYYKIKALHKLGFQITLHIFYNKRPPAAGLEPFAEKIYYYARSPVVSALSLKLPYIVSSRSGKMLHKNLEADNDPILFEGIHATYSLFTGAIRNRKTVVRQYNAEFLYYEMLAREEKNKFKKLYFKTESRLLRKYEKLIGNTSPFAAISEADKDVFITQLGLKNVFVLPAFVPYQQILCLPGSGSYCLYHGNLSVNENESAVLWMLDAFKYSTIKLIIAGKNPGHRLAEAVAGLKHIEIVPNPSKEKMDDLIMHAHINLVPSMNKTGVKLKLVSSLFAGRHCIVNTAALAGDEAISECCMVADSKEQLRNQIKKLMQIPFTSADIDKRKALLLNHFDNLSHAKLLEEWLR